MRYKLRLTLMVSMVFNCCYAQYIDDDITESGITLVWNVLENNYSNSEASFSELIITNNGNKELSSGWKIYFNFSNPRNADADSIQLKIEQINGDFFRIVPGKYFSALKPGQSVKAGILSRVLKKQTDNPKGFYIVFDAEPDKPMMLKTDINSLVDHRKEILETGQKTYLQNEKIKSIPLKELPPIFPSPLMYKRREETFNLNKDVKIVTAKMFEEEAGYLAEEIRKVTGVKPSLVSGSVKQVVILKRELVKGEESYKLEVNRNQVIISANDKAGIFYGIQSLKSLLPAGAWKTTNKNISIPGISVTDAPRFPHRAFMIEVARNFQSKEEVLKLIDVLSLYKINVLHFHLNDDEGWRLEIRGLAELTDVGSKRGHTLTEDQHLYPAYGSGPYTDKNSGSGYYSRKDFIDILKYANERHISVIPEFESPGHARAAIKSMDSRYRRLMNEGKKTEAEEYLLRDINDSSVYQSVQGWSDNVINPAMPSVYKFIQKLVDETVAMYREAAVPLKTIHFGGDEVPAGVWEKSPVVSDFLKNNPGIKSTDDLWYYYFFKVNQILKVKNLYLSGWEEMGERKDVKGMVLERRFSTSNFHLDVWNNLSGNEDLAYKLANAGYKVVLTNVTNLYLDLAYNKSYNEPGQYWGGYVDVEKPFSFIPLNYYKNQKENERGEPFKPGHFDGMVQLTALGKKNIVGLQATFWSEVITTTSRFEYLLLPKLLGVAERNWASDPKWARERDVAKSQLLYDSAWMQFINVLGKKELPRLVYYRGGFNYRIPSPGIMITDDIIKANVLYPDMVIRYTTNGKMPDSGSAVFKSGIPATEQMQLRVFDTGNRGGEAIQVILP